MDIKEKDKKTEEMCGLVDFHKDCLEILIFIDNIARENDIKYSTFGGTMLGQVRHKGFIPWDDDVDVFLTRENFNKLIEALNMETGGGSKFKLLTPKSYNGDFVDLVYRLVNVKNSYNSNYFGKYEDLKHPWVDIFALDNIPCSKIKFSIHTLRIKGIYALLCSRKKIKISLKINPIIKLGMFIFKILGKCFSMNFLIDRFNKVSNKYNNKVKYKKYVHCSNSMIDVDDIIKYEDIKDTIKLPFCNYNLQCYQGYVNLLTKTYGDYMTPRLDSNKFIRHFNLSKYPDEEIVKFYKNN